LPFWAQTKAQETKANSQSRYHQNNNDNGLGYPELENNPICIHVSERFLNGFSS
jgi:hypothetical protein